VSRDAEFAHAIALFEAGSFPEASERLRRLLEQDPGDVQAWSLLARAEFAAERYEQAVDAAERACALSPGSNTPHLLACVPLLRLERYDEAVGHAREAVRIDPFDWRALALLARLLVRDGAHVSEAQELVVRVVRLAPDAPEAHLTAGLVAARAADRDGAKRSFLRVLELDPGSSAAQHELARLRLKRRVNDPAALAEAATGFERALRAEPEAEQSRRTLELVLRVFLSKSAYLLFIDAYLVGRVTVASNGGVGRLLPAMLLLIPVFYAWRFCRRLTAPVVGRLHQVITREGPIRLAACCEALAVLCIVAGAGAPQSMRPGLAGTAGVLALIGRVALYTQVEHASRAVRGAPPRPAIRPGLLWVLAVLVGLIVVALLVAAVRDGGGPGALVVAAASAACVAILVRRARRRPTRGRN
jgi:tetratricopeptide (TPR) repeat protein